MAPWAYMHAGIFYCDSMSGDTSSSPRPEGESQAKDVSFLSWLLTWFHWLGSMFVIPMPILILW